MKALALKSLFWDSWSNIFDCGVVLLSLVTFLVLVVSGQAGGTEEVVNSALMAVRYFAQCFRLGAALKGQRERGRSMSTYAYEGLRNGTAAYGGGPGRHSGGRADFVDLDVDGLNEELDEWEEKMEGDGFEEEEFGLGTGHWVNRGDDWVTSDDWLGGDDDSDSAGTRTEGRDAKTHLADKS